MGINVLMDGTTYEGVDTITVGGKTLALSYVSDSSSGDDSSSGGENTGSGGTTSETLITNGLVYDFDFRNITLESYSLTNWGTVYKLDDKTGTAFIFGGNSDTCGDDVGVLNTNWRNIRYISDETKNVALGTEYTVQALYRSTESNNTYVQPTLFDWGSNVVISNAYKVEPKYIADTTVTVGEALEFTYNDTDAYRLVTYVVNGSELSIYYDDTLVGTLDGSEIEDFTKWQDYGVPNIVYNKGYTVSCVGYNRALTSAEIVDNIAYFKTLEVA